MFTTAVGGTQRSKGKQPTGSIGWGNKEVHVYLPIMEDQTGRVFKTFDQLLDDLMENKKGVAVEAMRSDEIFTPREDEEQERLKIFTGLADSAVPSI